jgi:nitronate monooxygenase
MLSTRFTELAGCTVPIQLAGMGGLDDLRLPAEVATAGGLGMIGLAGATPGQVAAALEQVRALTPGAIGVNFIIPFYEGETALTLECIATAATGARVVEFFLQRSRPGAGRGGACRRCAGVLAGWLTRRSAGRGPRGL